MKGKREHLCTVGGNANCGLYRGDREYLQIKSKNTYDSANLFPNIDAK